MWTVTAATWQLTSDGHPSRPVIGTTPVLRVAAVRQSGGVLRVRGVDEEFVRRWRWEVVRDRPELLGPTDISEVVRDMSDVSRLPGPMDHAWQWQRLGACRGMDSAVFFHPDGERNPSRARRTARAKEVCHRCPVMDLCREFALQTREPFGVWGGLAEAERRIILERRGLSAVS